MALLTYVLPSVLSHLQGWLTTPRSLRPSTQAKCSGIWAARWPSLNLLQMVDVFPVLGDPKLHMVLQTWSNECWVVGDDHIPWLTLHTAQHPVDSLLPGTLLSHPQLPVCLWNLSLFRRAGPKAVRVQPLLLQVIFSSSVQDFLFVLVEFSVEIPAGPVFPLAYLTAQPSSISTGPPHNLVFSAKLITKHNIAFPRLLINMISRVPG